MKFYDIEMILNIYKIDYVKEYKFSNRKFRFDFCILKDKIGIEYEGGTWTKGRHTRASGYARDCEKYNLAQSLGWVVLRYTVDMVKKKPEIVAQDIRKIQSLKK